MRLLYTLLIGLFIIGIEVYLGVQTFYPELTTTKIDVVDTLIQEKKSIVDQLSEKDLAWLMKNQIIIVGADPHFYPLETFDERGQYTGLAGDYLRLIAHMTGLNFQVSRQDDWASAEEMAQKEGVDMFMAIAATGRRTQYMRFTEPYISLPGIIMTRRGSGLEAVTIDDLHGKKVAVVQSYSWHDFLTEEHPAIEVLPVRDTTEALQLVANGLADAVIDYEFNLMEKLQVGGILQVQTAGMVDSTYGHGIAVRKDLSELYAIVDHALKNISPEERKAMGSIWMQEPRPAGEERRLQWYFFFFTQAVLLCLGIIGWAHHGARTAVRLRLEKMKANPA